MKFKFQVVAILVALLMSCRSLCVSAFAPSRAYAIDRRAVGNIGGSASTHDNFRPKGVEVLRRVGLSNDYNSFSSRYNTQLFKYKKGGPSDVLIESNERGYVILVLAIFAVIWSFSIPPEFRRAHFCFTEQCVQNRSKCYDCVTVGEWSEQVADYYRNGGGVNFDFSIDPNPKT
eukprot:CAMPEP_0196804872 /NCGR_PEP_ID=MMETSP1362-20130617/4557_1 /TAXON_ID=163516 /ORGANISM="Leptocylindrus danicus, Strain CCMP1856" /LENGTH=173 /DNA_ID=CAMNT_0042177433 /DNA_START=60 /DNA_END=581 /DNA_ORIENTATION=+